MKNWKTSVFGTGGLIFLAAAVLGAMFDGDPATNPDWGAVTAAAMPCIAALFARDATTTSKDMGLK